MAPSEDRPSPDEARSTRMSVGLGENRVPGPDAVAEGETASMERRRRILEVTAAGLVFGLVGLGLLAMGAHNAREAARAATCCGRIGEIGLAMLHYHEKYGHFPPAYVADANGRPMHSWRVLLLEFLNPTLFQAYDFSEPWDGPKNRQLVRWMPSTYGCPSHPESQEQGFTNYVVVVGEGTVFPGTRGVSIDEVRDGRDSTILVVEAVGLNIPWTEPRDLRFDEMSFKLNDRKRPSIGSYHRAGPHACMVDWTKVVLQGPPERIRPLLTIAAKDE